MPEFSQKIKSINAKLQLVILKMKNLEEENLNLKRELEEFHSGHQPVDLKYKNEVEVKDEVEEIRSTLSRFESEIETCIDMVEQAL